MLLTYTAILVCGAMLFTVTQGNRDVEDFLTALGIALLVPAAIALMRARLREWTRRDPFPLAVAKRSAGYFVAMSAVYLPVLWLTSALLARRSSPGVSTTAVLSRRLGEAEFWLGTFYVLVAIVVATFLSEVSRKLGPGVLWSWVLGRYHDPREEERVFMFLDLRGSTAMAERLGALRFSELIRELFADISDPIEETRGAVSHYIGDEVVVTWPLDLGVLRASCVECFLRVRDRLAARESCYVRRFGEAPRVKAGLHGGTVVATDVGEIKSEIVFHGEVLNVASRIQGLCTALGHDLLLSADLAARMEPPAGWQWAPLGAHRLRGKTTLVEVVGLTPAALEPSG